MALAEHSIDQTIQFVQSDSDFKLYNDRYKINGNDKYSDFKHGNPNVFHGKFRLRGGGGGVLIHPFFIMLLYRYLSHYGLLLHIMSQYYGYSLVFYKVYIRRENADSWNSGL